MISSETRKKYIVTIGIECHVQLRTKTKLFAAVQNDARDAAPNTLVSHICLGMPGALPVLNEKVIDYASMVAFALNTKPQKYSYFERKHYFYPDLPKGYQISQLASPIIVGGTVDIVVNGKLIEVNINRVQIEEDAGKSTHPQGKDYSLVDLNRAGTPLLEIVSEADMHSSAEAKAYAHELWILMRYTGVSDADMYHGNMRFDVNVSVSTDPKKLGLRTETKNLNSFKAVEKAVDFEVDRQIELIEAKKPIVQETRGWDDAKQKTFSQRTKEDAHDYRYMPEPDVPPVELTDEYIKSIEKNMPVLPKIIRTKLKELGLNDSSIETLLENNVLLDKLFIEEEQGATNDELKLIADWLVNVVIGDLNQQDNDIDRDNPENFFKYPGNLTKLAKMTKQNKVSSTGAKAIISGFYSDFIDPEEIAKKLDILQVSDEGEIEKIVDSVLKENPKAAEDVKNGEMKAIGFLVGQVMKASHGKANPELAQNLIKKLLG